MKHPVSTNRKKSREGNPAKKRKETKRDNHTTASKNLNTVFDFITQLNATVFPCIPEQKKPLTKGWQEKSTSSKKQIRQWIQKNPNANFGMPCDQYVVVDIDGELGKQTLSSLQAAYGPVDTFTVHTPHGKHLYFQKPEKELKNSAGKLPGIDIKTKGGYVLIPPSEIDGKKYEVVDDSEPAGFPSWLLDLLRESEREIPEGIRNDSLFRFACALRGKGEEKEKILDELEQLNQFCVPPLEQKDLETIAKSSCRYPPNPGSLGDLKSKFLTSSEIAKMEIPEPSWLIDNLVPETGLCMLAGPPGTFKSFVSLFTILKIQESGKKVLVFASEGGLQYLRRIQLLSRGLGIELTDNLMVYQEAPGLSGKDNQMEVSDFIQQNEIAFVVFDTLRTCFCLQEDQQKDWPQTVTWLTDIAKTTSVLLNHHLRKSSGQPEEQLLNRPSGPGFLVASCDLVFVTEKKKPEDTTFTLKNAKSRNTEILPDQHGELIDKGDSLVINLKDGSKKEKILNILREKGPLSKRKIREYCGGRDSTIAGCLEELKKEQKILSDQKKPHTVYSLPGNRSSP